MNKPAHKFTTITADDWRRSIAAARRRKNKAMEQIRAAAGRPGKVNSQ